MASTFSPILRIELIGTGDQSGTWGGTTNVNLGTLIEQAIAGTAVVDVSVGNVTLTNFNGTTDEARCMALRITGSPGVSRNVIAPAVSKSYIIANGSNNVVVLKTSGSTGLTVPAGEVYLAYYDTTTNDFRLVGRASSTANTANTLVLRDASGNFAAGTITANLTGNVTGNVTGNLLGTPTAPTATPGTNTTQIATTAFVTNVANSLGTMSTQNANAVAITGGTIAGTTVNGNVIGSNSVGLRTVSTSAPTGGANGDIWYRY